MYPLTPDPSYLPHINIPPGHSVMYFILPSRLVEGSLLAQFDSVLPLCQLKTALDNFHNDFKISYIHRSNDFKISENAHSNMLCALSYPTSFNRQNTLIVATNYRQLTK